MRRCASRCAIAIAVDEPVIGILIRTRIGLEVYGTNTELEKVSTRNLRRRDPACGSSSRSAAICVPGEYTITAASHDADGTAHDWVDDAVAFAVADSRYTAGVANLRAKVKIACRPAAYRAARVSKRNYFCSRINVGATPDSVEKPDGPTAVSQLEQPCTLPR